MPLLPLLPGHCWRRRYAACQPFYLACPPCGLLTGLADHFVVARPNSLDRSGATHSRIHGVAAVAFIAALPFRHRKAWTSRPRCIISLVSRRNAPPAARFLRLLGEAKAADGGIHTMVFGASGTTTSHVREAFAACFVTGSRYAAAWSEIQAILVKDTHD